MTKLLTIILLSIILVGSAYSQVAYYPFDGNADDESGNGYHGIVNGATLTTDRFGNPNSAYEFDGEDDFIELPNGFLPVGSTARTVTAWVNTYDNIVYEQAILQYGNSSTRQSIRFEIEDGQLALRTYSDDLISTPISANTWYFVAFTYDGTNEIIFYMNDVVVDTQYLAGPLNTQEGFYQECIGGGGSSGISEEMFNGKIDDLRIYDIKLSPQEISDIYYVETVAGLVAYYPLNGNANDQLFARQPHRYLFPY